LTNVSWALFIAMSVPVDMHASCTTLMRSDLALLADVIDISRRTFRKIRQNLFWAFARTVRLLRRAVSRHCCARNTWIAT